MSTRIRIASLAVLAIVVAACSGSSAGSGGDIADTSWTLKTYASGGSATSVPDGVFADLAFTADGAASGSSGCNQFSGSYTLDGATLTFGQLATTMRACDEPASTVEAAVLANLAAVRTFTATAETLELFDASGNAVLTYDVAAPGDLGGVTWHATCINNGRGAVTSVVAGTDPTLAYDPAGTVTGHTGCNTFNGPAVVDGTNIAIGPLMSTKMACVEEAANAQEAAYVAALEASTTFLVRGATLELRDADGALQVSFEAR